MLIARPSPFSAEHQYLPEWFLLVSRLSGFPLPTVFPSLIHVICGAGFPVAAQWNIVWSSSLTVWLIGTVIKLGGTEIKDAFRNIKLQHFVKFKVALNSF